MLQVSNISIGHGTKVIAEGISLCIKNGECVLLCGPNGSGKTTLLTTLAGYGASMVPSRIPKVKGFTVREFVRTALYKGTGPWGKLSPDGNRAIAEALATLGIGRLGDRDISTLSDGEFQKACIATALARRSDTILLDEPTAFLDPDSRIMVLEALRGIARGGRAVMFSSHDLHEAAPLCDRVIGIAPGGCLMDSAVGHDRQEIFHQCFERYGRETVYN